MDCHGLVANDSAVTAIRHQARSVSREPAKEALQDEYRRRVTRGRFVDLATTGKELCLSALGAELFSDVLVQRIKLEMR